MPPRRYQPTLNRHQDLILPMRVEDYVSPTNKVRAIDAYVGTLDLAALGYRHSQFAACGQPAFDPAVLLKLYLYGYLHRIHSRRLESEAARNLELMWLVEGSSPSYKTIADFRKNNGGALKATNRDFLLLCKEPKLFGGEEVAVDGCFFKANTSKSNIYTADKLDKQLSALEQKIQGYQDALAGQDAADDAAGLGSLAEDAQLADKIQRLQERQAEKQALRQQLKDSGNKQVSVVDEDARLLTKRGETTGGFNVQIAVGSKHKLIVANDVTQDGNDTAQLAPVLAKAQDILQSGNLSALADSGYFEGNQIKTCEDNGITVYVAVPDKSKRMAEQGRFTREQFSYDEGQDAYLCPQGETLGRCDTPRNSGNKQYIRYKSKASVCGQCALRSQCLGEKAKIREIERWEHEAAVGRHKERMGQRPDAMKQRAAIVEHPFGTLKSRAGAQHFLVRGVEKCRAEFSLMVLGYNFSRTLALLGVERLREYCVQRQGNGAKNLEYA
ncbi:MAG: transposase [Methylobacter sp.]|nr:MAG: transposase [Methylobacter sp.]